MSSEHQVTELRVAISCIETAFNKFYDVLGEDVAASGLGNEVLRELDALRGEIARAEEI